MKAFCGGLEIDADNVPVDGRQPVLTSVLQ